MKKKVIIGLSGGVDSSVAAYLLKEQGYDVIGVTMETWQEEHPVLQNENGSCGGNSAIDDARAVAEYLDIPYYVIDFKKEFRQNVMDYFAAEYFQGRTPNPCVVCNHFVKWEALLKKGQELGADYVATGHYARVHQLENGRYSICNSITAKKDQTYALYHLTQDQLRRTLMPIGEYEKEETRKIAEQVGLPVASKPDSQDICFIPDGDYVKFLKAYTNRTVPAGNFVTKDGKIIGLHKGIIHYTIGQRRGLDLPMGHRVFVTGINADSNEVVVGENQDLMKRIVYADHINLMSQAEIPDGTRVIAKIRYNHKGAPASIRMLENGILECIFDEPQRAITPGQALVMYDGVNVLGGGTIIGAGEY